MARVYKTEDGSVYKTDPRKVPSLERGGIARKRKEVQSDSKLRKQTFVNYLKNGRSIKEALKDMGLTEAQYKYLRQSDADFRAEMDRLRLMKSGDFNADKNREEIKPFPDWCEEYLDTKLFNHHLQWIDVLEGREPRNLHPNQMYIKGEPEFLLINTPPEHAKSTTITMNYVTYRICQDPNIRIIIVSQTQEMAKRFLRGIKDRLASDNKNYQRLQIDFAPEGGFDAGAASWTQDSIYISSSSRDSGEKDPTVQALGIGGHIYGSRADLIILDDCVTGKNAHEYQKQMDWLQREVYNRLSYPGGRIALVGTRLAPIDLYGEIVKDDYYGDEQSPWTYLSQPAVLEFAEDPKDWNTLWPRTNRPPVSLAGRSQVVQDKDGLWPMWTGEALRKRRASMSPRNWALVYQQESVIEDAIFPLKAVTGCVDGMRAAGVMQGGAPGHRPSGMAGLYIIGGFDPAMTGNSASIIMGVDRMTGERWVLDVWTKGQLKPDDIFDKIKEQTIKYGVMEWRIEKNAMNLMVTQNRDIRNFLASRGCVLKEHYTGCVPEDVRILTRNGWKAHDELTIGEEVLTHTGWELLDGVNTYDAPEKMYEVDTQNLSAAFTSDHRHLVEWRGNRTAEERFVTTEELKSNTPIRLSIDQVEGEGIGLHTAALLGWYVCEGQDKGAGVNIAQSPEKNPAKWQMIKDHLDALQWDYSIYHQETADRFHIKAKDAWILRELAPGKSKRLSVDTVARMSVAERDAFMEACLLGDGHAENFFNTEMHLIEAFEAAAILNGYTVRRSEHENGNGRLKKNKICWKVRRKIKRLAHVKMSGRDYIRAVPGSGKVWCPTTASGSWVAMSKGRSFVTGNSNKWDADFGVASMSMLFDGWAEKRALIHLPSRSADEGVKALIEQLTTWEPLPPGVKTKKKTDCVMALWFAEIRAREIIGEIDNVFHVNNPYQSPRDQNRTITVDLDLMGVAMQADPSGWWGG